MHYKTDDYSLKAFSPGQEKKLAKFIRSLVPLSPREAAVRLIARLLAEEFPGKAYFDVLGSLTVAETLELPADWTRELNLEFISIYEDKVKELRISTFPFTTSTFLEELTSGELYRVFEQLMVVSINLVPLLAEQALREHETNAYESGDNIHFIDMLLHLSEQDYRNIDNQRALHEWATVTKMRVKREEQDKEKQIVTEDAHEQQIPFLADLSTPWKISYHLEMHSMARSVEQRLREVSTSQPKPAADKQADTKAVPPELTFDSPRGRQIALHHIFNNRLPIRLDERAHKLAHSYGFKNGRNIYNYYVTLSKRTGITGAEGKELPSLITDIEAVLPFVEKKYQQNVQDILNTLILKQE